MRLVGTISADEVVATFLRGDLDSPRFGDRLRALLREDGTDVAVVTNPDLADPVANEYRSSLLGRHHEWLGGEHVFGPFPSGLDWFRAVLRPEEVLAIRYIDWDWWLRISGGTRLPTDAARRIRNGDMPGVTAAEHQAIAAALGSASPPPDLIVVAPPDRSKLVVVEGHVRLTAYALSPEHLPEELEILLGISAEIERWWAF
jgi:hypothetical protein